jgi:hypothetical protein
MHSVTVQIHKVPDVDPVFEVPRADLWELFRRFGVLFTFEPGADLPSDPATWENYRNVLEGWYPIWPPVGSPAHLIIGRRWEDEGGASVNGLLITPRRGAVAIFTESTTLSARRPGDFLQTCAHELCHLLNLQHDHGSSSIPTAECQEMDRRDKRVDEAWRRMKLRRPKGSLALPLSNASKQELSRADNAFNILPWGSPFLAGGMEAEDRWAGNGRSP